MIYEKKKKLFYTCENCQKQFYKYSEEWAYKIKTATPYYHIALFCSYHCLQSYKSSHKLPKQLY